MHRLILRVYYEDTDLAGVVYYANYLRFIERGRTEWVRERGVEQGRLREEEGLVFAVRRLDAEYLLPARFDDVIEVRTELVEATGARVILSQEVRRDDQTLFSARVTLVALDRQGRPRRIPARLLEGAEASPA
jgi:acyl-CoA thioester hydrolase